MAIYNYKATLKNRTTIEVSCNKNYDSPEMNELRLYEDGKFKETLHYISKIETMASFIYTFPLKTNVKPGKLYEVFDHRGEYSPLDISYLASLVEFEKKYRYEGKLGSFYSKEETDFKVFAPLACEVICHIEKDGKTELVNMHRNDSGVFEGYIKGDYEGASYYYIANISGRYVKAVDPYAKSLSTNSRYAYIIDENKIRNIDDNSSYLPKYEGKTKSIIYELDVRDMTSLTSLKNKGTYEALTQEGLKDRWGRTIGIDYIASLGVSHVQLMPIYDFSTILDDAPLSSYNWGYDPKFYFAPEGSYSSDPNDPYCRLIELKNLVSAFHKKGIRVNMDVVFNHTFQVKTNSLELLCPSYYYRRYGDGSYVNGSGCGNELETSNYMMRKLIIDCCRYYVETFGFDGFRFDLMGLIDQDTILKLIRALKKVKPELMIYGEGWDMNTTLPQEKRTSLSNAFSLLNVSFFNDRFRNISRGNSYGAQLSSKGYLSGDLNYIDGYKHVFLGSCISLAFPPLFSSPNQSINYVECHDDATLYDKLKAQYPHDSEEKILKRLKLTNACTILACGVPFIHQGQEYGHTKKMVSNSYQAGDEINGFDYQRAYKNKDCIQYLRDVIKLKKSYPLLSLDSRKEVFEKMDFENLPFGGLLVKYLKDKKVDLMIFINPSDSTISYELDKYYSVIFDEKGFNEKEEFFKQVEIEPLSIKVLKTL